MTAKAYDDVKQEDLALAMISGDAAFFEAVAQDGAYADLVRKMGKQPAEIPQIAYEFTDDVALLHQYYILREEMFKRVWDLKNFTAEKDSVDEISHILVAKRGLQCIGGGRLTITTSHNRQKLPMEGDDFILSKALPDLNLDNCDYCEVTRVAALSEYTKENVAGEIIGGMFRKSIAENCSYGFFISPLNMTRTHRRVVNHLGYNLTTRRDVEIPDRVEYEGIKMFLSYADLRSYLPKKSHAEQAVSSEPVLELSGH